MKWIAGIFVICLALLAYMQSIQRPWKAGPCDHTIVGSQICVWDEDGAMRTVTGDKALADMIVSHHGLTEEEIEQYFYKQQILEDQKINSDMKK